MKPASWPHAPFGGLSKSSNSEPQSNTTTRCILGEELWMGAGLGPKTGAQGSTFDYFLFYAPTLAVDPIRWKALGPRESAPWPNPRRPISGPNPTERTYLGRYPSSTSSEEPLELPPPPPRDTPDTTAARAPNNSCHSTSPCGPCNRATTAEPEGSLHHRCTRITLRTASLHRPSNDACSTDGAEVTASKSWSAKLFDNRWIERSAEMLSCGRRKLMESFFGHRSCRISDNVNLESKSVSSATDLCIKRVD